MTAETGQKTVTDYKGNTYFLVKYSLVSLKLPFSINVAINTKLDLRFIGSRFRIFPLRGFQDSLPLSTCLSMPWWIWLCHQQLIEQPHSFNDWWSIQCMKYLNVSVLFFSPSIIYHVMMHLLYLPSLHFLFPWSLPWLELKPIIINHYVGTNKYNYSWLSLKICIIVWSDIQAAGT